MVLFHSRHEKECVSTWEYTQMDQYPHSEEEEQETEDANGFTYKEQDAIEGGGEVKDDDDGYIHYLEVQVSQQRTQIHSLQVFVALLFIGAGIALLVYLNRKEDVHPITVITTPAPPSPVYIPLSIADARPFSPSFVRDYPPLQHMEEMNVVPPILARTLHLILVENMEEVKEFTGFLPGLMSDVVFNCWKDVCSDPRTTASDPVFVGSWHSHADHPYRINREGQVQSFNRKTDILFDTHAEVGDKLGLWKVRPSIYFINEPLFNFTHRTSLTESRNLLAAFVRPQEQKQGWQWAYITIQDGDGHVQCGSFSGIDAVSWMYQFEQWKTLMPKAEGEARCWMAYNAFLLTVGPAVGIPQFIDPHDEWVGGMMTFHFDGVIAAYHHEVFQLFHPLCERFDSWTYWSSQAYLVTQGICLIGHVYTISFVHALNADHRSYPRNLPFAPFTDAVIREMNLFPSRLLYMWNYLRTGNTYRFHLTPLISFDFYPGFDRKRMLASDCSTIMLNTSTCIRTPT